MSPLIILAIPVVAVATIALTSCILAGRRERFLDDPAPDEAEYQPSPPPTPASTNLAPIPVRLAAEPDQTEG
jgi:hypothetical protein